MGHSLDRQKWYYDVRIHGEPYKEGVLVWLHSPVVPKGTAQKLHRPWTGPYKIVHRLSDATYRIQDVQQPQHRLVIDFDRLKHCPNDIRLPHLTPGHRQSNTQVTPTVNRPGTNLALVPPTDDPMQPTPRYPHKDRHPPTYLHQMVSR